VPPYRKSLDAQRDDERNRKDKNGNWRHTADVVEGHIFNNRATKEPPGFKRGARIKQEW
jgi:hypothetical protein